MKEMTNVYFTLTFILKALYLFFFFTTKKAKVRFKLLVVVQTHSIFITYFFTEVYKHISQFSVALFRVTVTVMQTSTRLQNR